MFLTGIFMMLCSLFPAKVDVPTVFLGLAPVWATLAQQQPRFASSGGKDSTNRCRRLCWRSQRKHTVNSVRRYNSRCRKHAVRP